MQFLFENDSRDEYLFYGLRFHNLILSMKNKLLQLTSFYILLIHKEYTQYGTLSIISSYVFCL